MRLGVLKNCFRPLTQSQATGRPEPGSQPPVEDHSTDPNLGANRSTTKNLPQGIFFIRSTPTPSSKGAAVNHRNNTPKPISMALTQSASQTDFAQIQVQPDVTELNVSRCRGINNSELKGLLKKLPNVTSIHLENGDQISNDGLETLPASTTKLNLNNCPLIDDKTLTIINERCPKLKELYLSRTKIKGCTHITNKGLQSLPKTLTKLDLSGHTFVNDKALETISKKCPDLRSLNLSGCYELMDHELTNLPAKLTELDLTDCHQISNYCLATLPSSLTNLNLTNCKKITEDGLSKLKDKCPNLAQINLVGCWQIPRP